MPQDRDKTSRAENARAERPAANAGVLNAQFGDVCGNIKAGLHAQQQMMDVLHDISRTWFSRVSLQTELAFKLPARLSAAHTVPDVLSAYQEWLGEWAAAVDQDNRRLVAEGKRVVDEGMRYFTMPSSGATT